MFQSILKNSLLNFHKQSLDILELYVLPQIEDNIKICELDRALLPYVDTVHSGLYKYHLGWQTGRETLKPWPP